MANEKQIDKICRMLDDLITKSKRDTNSEPVKEQLKSPDFYEGYKIGFESAQPKWISVEERLPDGVCLTRNDAGAMLIGRVSKCQHREAYRCDDEHDMYAMFDVTHWMPLPEPPKEEE